MEVVGEIIILKNTETIGSSGFRKRDVVVKTEEQYTQEILVQFVQDKVDVLDNYSVGDKVTIKFNLRGKKWTNADGIDKYFNTLQGWSIVKNG